MQALVELIATVVVWMAVATLNQMGIKAELPRAEPKAEKVIRRESAKPETAASQTTPCPDSVRVKRKTVESAA